MNVTSGEETGLFGVTVGGALFGATVDLTHGGVEIDHQILIAGTGTQLPRPPQQPGRDGVAPHTKTKR